MVHFSYIGAITDENMTGKEVVYRAAVAPSLDTFVSYRFEDIVRSYFHRLVLSGARRDILRIGSYWYDDKVNKRSGEFDVALALADGTYEIHVLIGEKWHDEVLALADGTYEIHECKFLKTNASSSLVSEEKAKAVSAPLVGVCRFGFVSSSGFVPEDVPGVDLISGEDMYFSSLEI